MQENRNKLAATEEILLMLTSLRSVLEKYYYAMFYESSMMNTISAFKIKIRPNSNQFKKDFASWNSS